MQVGQAVLAPKKNMVFRAARAILLIALAGTAVIGLLHAKAAQPLLAKLGGCPVQHANRDNMDAIRKYAIAQSPPADGTAPARPALGFKLDQTTEDEVRTWAKANKVACEENSTRGSFVCKNVPGSALGDPDVLPVEELTMAFSPAGKLVNLLAMREALTSTKASQVFVERTGRLAKEIGAPSHAGGKSDPAFFDEDILRTAIVDYKYRDYEATVSATTMLDRTVAVREHYLSTL
jgi:hypothetical protein